MPINISQAADLIAVSHTNNHEGKEPKGLYEPRNYIMSHGGKRMRSILCLIGYGFYKADQAEALDLAYAIELFHNFTLVHDDIMDEAPTRRGRPSVHTEYSIPSAILTGDAMLIEVYERLGNLDYANPLEMVMILSGVAREVCEGQSMDMDFETREDVSIAEYLKMIELKTAVLLGAAIEMGAKLAGASQKDQEHLRKYATNSGISFQIQDDYLDVYGDPEVFGKKVGGDIIQGKKTYLYLRALDLLEAEDKEGLRQLYNRADLDEAEKVTRVRAIFDELFLPNYCEEVKKAYHDLAASHLAQTSLTTEQKEDLSNFSLQLMNRDS